MFDLIKTREQIIPMWPQFSKMGQIIITCTGHWIYLK